MIKECRGTKEQPPPVAGVVMAATDPAVGGSESYYYTEGESAVSMVQEVQDPSVNWFQTTTYPQQNFRQPNQFFASGRGSFPGRGQFSPRGWVGNRTPTPRGLYGAQLQYQAQPWRLPNPAGHSGATHAAGYVANPPNQTCTHCQQLNDRHGIPTNYANHVVLDCPRIKAG